MCSCATQLADNDTMFVEEEYEHVVVFGRDSSSEYYLI